MDDWGDLIGYSVQMRLRLRLRLRLHGPVLNDMSIPHLGATTEELDAAEARLGHPLDPLHRELLSYGNGWESFFVYTDLFSTDEIGQGPRWSEELEMTQIRYFPYEGAERLDLDEPDP